MKQSRVDWGKLLGFTGAMLVGIVAAAYFLFAAYAHVIDERLFAASSASLEETNREVVQIFDEISTARWNYLEQIAHTLTFIDPADTDTIRSRVSSLKERYGFTEFYFLSENGNYLTVNGESGYIDLGDNLFALVDDGENVVTDGSLPTRQNMFFYAAPAEPGTFDGFAYCAIAFGYDKESLTAALSVQAYHGECDLYLVYPNGRVGISLGGVTNEIRNFVSSLTGAVDDDTIQVLADGLQNGATDTISVMLDGTEYYLSYQPAGRTQWRLVSLTPVSAADRTMTEIRSSSNRMMAGAFLLILLMMAAVAFYWLWRALRDKNSLLAERELIFEVMSEHMNEIFLLYDEETRKMLYISPNVSQMLGVSPEEVYAEAMVLNRCVEKKGAWKDERFLDGVRPGETLHREYNLINCTNGEVRPYTLDLYRPTGRNSHDLVIVLTDNTREQRVRQEITEAMESARAANAAKSTFLSNMSHDIRTPMNAIIGFTTLLDRDAEDPAQVHQYTEKIRRSGRHLLGLINEVLDMSKIEAGKTTLSMEPTNIDDVAEQMADLIRPLADAKHQTFVLTTSLPADESVLADRLRLTQILQNLLSNAVKYTQDGGRVELSIERINQREEGGFASYRFVVRDNGMGMSEEYLKQIFTPFSRETNSTVNKIQGTGLGMAITKNLIDLMGGTIHVVSKPGAGSTFDVVLGFRTVERRTAEEQAACGECDYSLSGMRILAAEDNELNAEILVELLKMEGAACDVTENGQEVLEKFEAAAPGQYDLILMDVQMPVMNGYEATRAIRKSRKNPEGKEIPIIAMTANAFTEDVQAALAAGMNAHLSKPVEIPPLKQTVQQVLAQAAAHRKI